MGLSDWTDEFDKASSGNRSEYMKAGNFYLRIDLVKEGKNQKKIDNFKVEGTIIHKLDPSGEQNVGQSVCDMYSAVSQFYASELKGLAAGISGKSSDQVKMTDLIAISGDAQPLKGVVVEYLCYDKDTKNGGKITKKICKGVVSSEDVKGALSEDSLSRFGSSLKLLG